ncbi:MAG: hypothetical protein RLZZ600_1184 [Actinomycetota bacterium]|jgi:hypothetical protein
MPDLEITSVEKTTIIALDDAGIEYRISVDDASLARLKRAASASNEARVSPREIQALLRSGLSDAEVAHMTGASIEQIERYSGPVMAEREYVITTAQTLPAFAHVETSGDASLFGEVIGERLDSVDGRERLWTAWKDENGRWILKISFTVGGIEKDARWNFDAKRSHVLPVNDEALKLSAPGSFEPTPAPTLRAVPNHVSAADVPISEINESGVSTSIFIEDAPEAVVTSIDSEDLLEALRRRRSNSDDAPAWLKEDVAARTAPVEELVQDSLDISLDETDDLDISSSAPVFPLSNTGGHKRNRPTMPKWDEIVSETKSDDDLI